MQYLGDSELRVFIEDVLGDVDVDLDLNLSGHNHYSSDDDVELLDILEEVLSDEELTEESAIRIAAPYIQPCTDARG